MATNRRTPTRFDKKSRVRVRDNIKVKRITVMTPYVLHGKALNIKDSQDVLEVVVPITGSIFNVTVILKDSSGELLSTLYKNDVAFDESPFGQLVEEGDILRYNVEPKKAGTVVASKVLFSIAILPKYDGRFILNDKVDEE